MIKYSAITNCFSKQSLKAQLERLHQEAYQGMPFLDRIACVLYQPIRDRLSTFISSTREGTPLDGYEVLLSQVPSLHNLAKTRQCRLIEGISDHIQPDSSHSYWLLDQRYDSSFTVPLFQADTLFGFIFFDSYQRNVFSEDRQQTLRWLAQSIFLRIQSDTSLVNSLMATVHVARHFIDLRDVETGQHINRMAEYSRLIAKGIAAEYRLSDEMIELIYRFAPLHDIGKVGIPDSILLKSGKLNSSERRQMETHVIKGLEIIDQVLSDYKLSHLSTSGLMRNIVAHHHEFLDGTGYPKGLIDAEIPVESRIVTVADIFDALTCSRPYKTPWTLDDAFYELNRMTAEGKLDLYCVTALISQRSAVQAILDTPTDRLH